MTPEELAARHPKLYHVTEPGVWSSIAKFGLLPAIALVELFEVDPARRHTLVAKRRPQAVRLDHPHHGAVILNDNVPLSEKALNSCLDDGLSAEDWLRLLNSRVFFWADLEGLGRLLGARLNRNRPKEVLTFDTLGLVKAHAARVELSPINSGSTIRKPARRGLTTFTPLLAKSYEDWQRQRGGRDRIREVVVRGGVLDIERYLLSSETIHPISSVKT